MEIINDIIKFIVDIFAGGRSSVRVALFIIYLLFIWILSLEYIRSRLSNFIKFSSQNTFRLLIVSIFLLFSVTLLSQFKLSSNMGAPLSSLGVIFHNGEISSSGIFHNHIGKGSISYVLNSFGISTANDGMDIGFAYQGIINNYVYLAILILFLITFIIFVANWLNVSGNLLNAGQGNRQKYLFLICYSIFSFSILKNAIDGGLLNHEVLPSLIGIYLINNWQKPSSYKLFWAYALVTIILIIVKLITNNFSYLGDGYMFLRGFIGSSGLTIILTSMMFKVQDIKSKVLIVIIFVSSMMILFGSKIDYYAYKYLNVSASDELYVFSKTKLNDDFVYLYSTGELMIYRNKSKINDTVQGISNRIGVPINYYPVMIPGFNCNPMKPYQEVVFKLVDIDNVSGDFIEEVFVLLSDFQNKDSLHRLNYLRADPDAVRPGTYAVSIYFSDCVSRKIDIIEGVFSTIGLQTFYIYDIEDRKAQIMED